MDRTRQIAVVHLDESVLSATNLKRLALLFDEVKYVFTPGHIVKDHVYIDPERAHSDPEYKDQLPQELVYGSDTYLGIHPTVSSMSPEVVETLQAFSESGVATEFPVRELTSLESDETFSAVRKLLLQLDSSDPEFSSLMGDSPETVLRATHKSHRIENSRATG